MKSKKWGKSPRFLTIQLAMAVLLTVAGLVLLGVGLAVPPLGEIHNTVLVAYGEICTFAGALCGVDFYYRRKLGK